MRSRAKISVLLSAVLLLSGLTACKGDEMRVVVPSTPSPSPTGTVRDDDPPEESGNTEPVEEDDGVAWDPTYRLDIEFTPVSPGQLELPVQGATGYASVELPLWEEIPEDEPEPEAEPGSEPTPEVTPEPAPTPEVTPEPEPSPEPPPEPETADTQAEPAPGEGVSPAPEAQDGGGGQIAVTEPEGENSEVLPGDAETQEDDPAGAEEPAAETQPGSEEEPPEPEPMPDPYEGALAVLAPGTAFTILEEADGWWRVTTEITDGVTIRDTTGDETGDETGNVTGWIEYRYCLINLPDVIPSIIYNDTNSDASLFVSSGKDIPGITGKALYSCKAYNPRLGREEYLMPVLYTMAKHICQAQQQALAEGNTLVLYESYRPYETQRAVVQGMLALSNSDPEVKAGISTPPWNVAWFIATGYSNHQRGFAIDVSLAKVTVGRAARLEGHPFVRVRKYEEYTMPTPIHELSMAAATFTTAVGSMSSTAWKSAELTPAMSANEPAKALQRYCTDAGLTPLASEWWHFNDLQAYTQAGDNLSTGGYFITNCRSVSVKTAQSMAASS